MPSARVAITEAERQDDDYRGGEAGAAPEGAQRESEIVPHVADHLRAVCVALASLIYVDALARYAVHVAELSLRLGACHLVREARGNEVGRAHLQVEGELVAHVAADVGAERLQQPAPAGRGGRHCAV